MTYREIIYIVTDLCKQFSDDTTLTEDHVLFLLNKYRGTLLYQYSKQKMLVPHENYQTILIKFNPLSGIHPDSPTKQYYGAQFESNHEVPKLMSIGNPLAYTYHWFIDSHSGIYNGHINIISRERMRYIGYSNLVNEVYFCIAPDIDAKHKAYVKVHNSKIEDSSLPDLPTLDSENHVYLTGVFEDAIMASQLEPGFSDLYSATFPIDTSLIPNLLQAVVKDILGASYRPKDGTNDANDDLASLAYFIQKNVKSALAKQLDANNE